MAEVAHGKSVYDVAVSGAYVYWSDGSRIMRASSGDASAPAGYTDTGVSLLGYLAVDPVGRVFATTAYGIAIGPCGAYDKCKSADPVEGTFYSPLGPEGASGIALAGDLLFWGHEAPVGVARANRSTLEASPRAELDHQTPTAEPVSGVAADDTRVYWIAGDRAILATPVAVAPDAPERVCAELGDDAGFGANADLAVDDDWVYFTRPSLGLIQKCKKGR
jgi:hypothetical protein